ncbi:hypothetical protein KR093_002752, partial [Drosophila rubida]
VLKVREQLLTAMESQIKAFYKKKTIFLTGGSGFMGRVAVEKLLRSTDAARIYVLMRQKRGQSPQERIESWKTIPLFELLLKSKPNALERVVSISGDCEEPDLGISLADREILKKEVQVVLHCAATVNFFEVLHKALDINTRATRLMLELAREMQKLEAFVYVSTAFSNCVFQHITEKFYPGNLRCSADNVLKVRKLCDDMVVDGMAPALLDKFPNTYTYTKALAEQLIQTESDKLPVCIYRPGSIVSTNREPIPGWIDNIYGPIASMYGYVLGIIRLALMDANSPACIIPVDLSVNLLLACAWHTATASNEFKTDRMPPTIYNHVPHAKNLITYGQFLNFVDKIRHIYPFERTIWYPIMHTTTISWLFKVARIFYHVVPGHVMDFVLLLRGQKPRMVRLYAKMHKAIDKMAYFSNQKWTFEATNTDQLWQSLSIADKELFAFDMRSLDWNKFLTNGLSGLRLHLAKEEASDESIRRAR